jgi:hypothetical protein
MGIILQNNEYVNTFFKKSNPPAEFSAGGEFI